MPLSTILVQTLHKLGEYFPRAYRQYSTKFTFSEMPLPILLAVLDPYPPTIYIYIYICLYMYNIMLKIK